MPHARALASVVLVLRMGLHGAQPTLKDGDAYSSLESNQIARANLNYSVGSTCFQTRGRDSNGLVLLWLLLVPCRLAIGL